MDNKPQLEQPVEEKKDLSELSEVELEELATALGEDGRASPASYPKAKEKQDIMNFFNNVLERSDTTKVSNLSDEELEAVRLMQRAGLYSLEIKYLLVAKYIKGRAEILLATALSGRDKGGFFLKIINSQKRILEAVSRKSKEDTSPGGKKWWKRK